MKSKKFTIYQIWARRFMTLPWVIGPFIGLLFLINGKWIGAIVLVVSFLMINYGLKLSVPVSANAECIRMKKLFGYKEIEIAKIRHIYVTNYNPWNWRDKGVLIKMPGALQYYHTFSDELNNLVPLLNECGVIKKPWFFMSEIVK